MLTNRADRKSERSDGRCALEVHAVANTVLSASEICGNENEGYNETGKIFRN